jgi:hypothetical protein
MSRKSVLSRLAALALVAAPIFAFGDSGQPCPKCTHPCASTSESKKAEAKPTPQSTSAQSTSAEEQQRIWTSP